MVDVSDVVPTRVDVDTWPPGLDEAIGAGHDAVVVFLPKPLAGLGTKRQLAGLVAGLAGCPRPVVYVGPATDDGPDLLATPLVEVPVVDDVPGTFAVCARAMTEALTRLAADGVRRPLVVTMGYTAFGPDAARRALPEGRRAGIEHVTVVLVDSAFPDADVPRTEVDVDGWPLDRFHHESYASQPGLTVHFALTSAYDMEPRVLAARRPPVSAVGVVAPPYDDDYIDRLAAQADGRGGSAFDHWPALGARRPGDLVIPFVSSDIWSPDAVGSWMSEEEYATVVDGTIAVFRGLALLASRRGGRVVVPIDATARPFLERELGTVLSDETVETGLIPMYFTGLEQAVHARLLATADLAVSRTGGQANASVVLALVGTPSVVIDLPARGYMQAELSSVNVEWLVTVAADGEVTTSPRPDPLGWFGRWTMTDSQIADLVEEVLTEDRATRASASRTAFESLRSNPARNLFSIIAAAVAPATVGHG